MDSKEKKLIRKITSEYIKFMKKTSSLVEESKRATVLALKKVLNLKDGDLILINDDGSIEVDVKVIEKEKVMAEEKNNESKKVTLNGREISTDELERQREAVKNQKGAKLEEVSEGNFRLRLDD